MAKMKERAAQFMYTEVGLAAQGFFLEATAMGLGSTFVGGFKPAEARAVLGLAAGEESLAVLPVGHKP
jgi:nitroreductase